MKQAPSQQISISTHTHPLSHTHSPTQKHTPTNGGAKAASFCLYVCNFEKNWKRNLLSKTTKILFCAAKPTTTTRATKKTKQKQKGETCLHISLYRNESDIYEYIYIIYRMWAHLAPSENCNKQTENRVQHTLRFLILQILLLLWLYMYIIIL